MANRKAPRKIDNLVPGTDVSLGTIEYQPVRGHTHAKQDPVATMLQYGGSYNDAKAFALGWGNVNNDKKPDVTTAERKSREWFAGMILGALEIEQASADSADIEEARIARDAVCALYAEAVVLLPTLSLIDKGVRKQNSDGKRAKALEKQNRPTKDEAAARRATIRSVAKSIPGISALRKKEAIKQIEIALKKHPQKPEVSYDAICRTIRGYKNWPNSADS